MFHPPAYYAETIQAIAPERLANEQIKCMCGKNVPLKDTIGVYINQAGTDDFSYYPACNARCITTHISMGSA